ncbi:MAG TPA: tetratricopeptide repeat protein [Pyrinomonadaceae bacterium]|nr:tetratricopeptide repeat protein [Pyrinomonadaceae bacterium]
MNTRTLIRLALLLLLAVISAPVSRPQEKDDSKKSEQAAASHQEWRSKQDAKDEWSRKEPQTGEEWFARGYEMHNSDRYPEAIEAFKCAADLGHRRGTAMYNIACGYSLLNDKENAFDWLARALSNDFSSTDLLFRDSDLDPLRSDPRFKLIVSSVSGDTNYDRRGKTKPDRLEQANLEFAQLERDSSKEGVEWARVGVQLLRLRDLDRSIVALNRAVNYLDYEGATAMYNLACAYALKGDRQSGIQWLEKSVNTGFDSPQKLRNDPDINILRSDARFPAIEKLSNTLTLSQFPHDKDNFSRSDNSEYSKERWAPAIVLYESFVKSEPNNGRAWFNLGYAFHYSREHAKAIAAFERALALGYHKPTATYNVACGYAMLNQRDAAFDWLDRAIAAGFNSLGDLGWDRDLDNLRSDPRFKRFVDSANYNTKLRTKK